MILVSKSVIFLFVMGPGYHVMRHKSKTLFLLHVCMQERAFALRMHESTRANKHRCTVNRRPGV